MRQIERKPPTHIMTVRIPLCIETTVEDAPRGELTEALNLVLPLIRLGTTGMLCDDIEVTLGDAP